MEGKEGLERRIRAGLKNYHHSFPYSTNKGFCLRFTTKLHLICEWCLRGMIIKHTNYLKSKGLDCTVKISFML